MSANRNTSSAELAHAASFVLYVTPPLRAPIITFRRWCQVPQSRYARHGGMGLLKIESQIDLHVSRSPIWLYSGVWPHPNTFASAPQTCTATARHLAINTVHCRSSIQPTRAGWFHFTSCQRYSRFDRGVAPFLICCVRYV